MVLDVVQKSVKGITTILIVVVVLFYTVACSSDKKEIVDAVKDRAATPQLHAEDITTVISDSGITRYRISAPQWDIFDKANPPYWEFPMGVYFEKFDENLKVDANIHCNYAKYLLNEEIWDLRGKVKAMNLQGELFETERLFWDQRNEKIYTDSVVKITRQKYIFNTVGFVSNQTMTQYTFKKTTGIIAAKEE